MKAENLIKGIVTTLIGLALMSGAAYGWYTKNFGAMESLIAGCIGFVICFWRTKLDDVASDALRGLVDKYLKK